MSKPETTEKDYFDEIQEGGHNKSAGNGQPPQSIRFRDGGDTRYDALPSEDNDSDREDLPPGFVGDSGLPKTFLSFVDPSSPSPPVPTNRPPIQLEKVIKESPDDEDDEYYGSSLKYNRRQSATRPPNIQDLDQSAVQRHMYIGNNFNNNQPGKGGFGKKPNGPGPTPASWFQRTVTRISTAFPVPALFRRKNSGDYKIQIFVAFMLILIISIVGSIYVTHKEKELKKAYFDRIRFTGKDRRIRVSNLRGREVLSGILGATLSDKDRPWDCLEENRKSPNGTCLEWMHLARLYFRVSNPRRDWDLLQHNTTECYEILWEGINSNFVPKDCYNIGENKYFYGGGELYTNQWPLHRASVPLVPFITGSNFKNDQEFQWGRTQRRYFVGSPGVAIEISRSTPLQVSINDEQNPGMLCFAAKGDSFATPNYRPPNVLNYTLCTGDNVRDVFTQLADKEIWNGLNHDDVHVAHALAASPVWKIPPQTIQMGLSSEMSLLNHTDHIMELQLSTGFIQLDESWQRNLGDLEFDPDRFPTIGETVNITRRRGFKIAVTVQPYFSIASTNYATGVEKGLWVRQNRHKVSEGEQSVPAMTSYRGSTVVLLDITKKESRTWIRMKLNDVVKKYGIDGLFMDFGSTSDFPRYYEFESLSSPDEYKEAFMKAVMNLRGVYAIGTSGAKRQPKLPTFVSLSPIPSTWEGLQTIIPNMLTLGVAGFPFVTPGVVGGDFMVSTPTLTPNLVNDTSEMDLVNVTSGLTETQNRVNDTNNGTATFVGQSDGNGTLSGEGPTHAFTEQRVEIEEYGGGVAGDSKPDRELYARWMELVHFLPVVQYSRLPSDYDPQLVSLAQELKSIRKLKLYPYFKKAINDALTSGLPIIRPLWMSDPTDANCLKIWDEYTIGGDILVAPILYPNSTEREIYLPKGRWRDGMDGSGSSIKGDRWIHHYRLKQDQIAFFFRLEEPSV